MSERPIIVFDVDETLLDLDAIRPVFDRIFHDPAAMRLWFAGLITYSEALTLADVYVPFTDISGAVLRMLAATRGLTISDADAAELTDRFATMPPHPEVPAALRRLRDHGFRLFTLTDNTLEVSGRQLERGGVRTGPVSVDLAAVRERKRAMVGGARENYASRMAQDGLDLIEGEARLTGPKTLEIALNGGGMRQISAPVIVIDTGARPGRRPSPAQLTSRCSIQRQSWS
jgi:2-haloalkanoic acid dehalogenase type II